MSRYLSAKQVTDRLGISAATLYSYVSRGLIRSEEAGGDHRARRYHAEDVERLLRRKEGRRDPAKSAREALQWGEPVLESAITLIADGALYYRGQDVITLAQTQIFEGVAALLWTGEMSEAAQLFRDGAENSQFALTPQPPLPNGEYAWERGSQTGSAACWLPSPSRAGRLSYADSWRAAVGRGAGGEGDVTPLAAMQIALANAADDDLHAYDLAPRGVMRTGARIIRLLTWVCAGNAPGATTAERLATAWRTPHARLLDAALVLCADHELNASSFAARVIASTGATPYAVVAGALAALSGHKHGGHTLRVAALLDEIEQIGDGSVVVRARLARGEGIPGFGHTLYPDGDPRAAALLAMMRERLGDTPDRYGAIGAAIQSATGKAPTLDYALVALERRLGLPRDSAFMLFAIGRSAGWLAHAIEQYARPELLRPRAKYVGYCP